MGLHALIEREDVGCAALCLELDVASQGETVEEARASLTEAVDLYLEAVCERGDQAEFVPRPAPADEWARSWTLRG